MPKRKIVVNLAESTRLSGTCHNVHRFSDHEIDLLRTKLLNWYDNSQRQLPWRSKAKDEKDVNKRAYAVWVSEVMLQQTQVATVIDYYNKWMKKWPTLQDLAMANLEEVNEVWSGLGYYSRGQRLHQGACKVVSELDGQMPCSAKDLEKLPGVGRYTASAVASIAMGERVGLVDGNVSRVFARLRIIGAVISNNNVTSELWRLANDTVDPDRPGDYNQALMELGAMVCTPKSPQCSRCPLASLCLSKLQEERRKESCAAKMLKMNNGRGKHSLYQFCDIEDCELCLPSDKFCEVSLGVTIYPQKSKKKPPRIEKRAVCVLSKNLGGDMTEEYLIIQRHDKGLLANMWEFPSVDVPVTTTIGEAQQYINQYLENNLSMKTQSVSRSYITEIVHAFSHIQQTYIVEKMKLTSDMSFNSGKCNQAIRWVTEDEFNEAAMSSAMRKIFKAVKDLYNSSSSQKNKLCLKKVNKDGKKQLDMKAFFSKR